MLSVQGAVTITYEEYQRIIVYFWLLWICPPEFDSLQF